MTEDEKAAAIEECNEEALVAVKRIAEEQGLTAHKILKRLAEALDATEVKPIKTTVYDDKGKPKSHRIRYTKKLVAHGPRLKAIELGMNFHRMMPKQEIELSGFGSKGNGIKFQIEIVDPRKDE